MVRVVLSDPLMSKAAAECQALAKRLDEAFGKQGIRATFFPAQPAPIPRLRDRYRYDLLMTFDTAAGLMTAVDLFKSSDLLKTRCKTMIVDVDPVSLQ